MGKYNGQYIIMVLLMFIGNVINILVSGGSGTAMAITGTIVVAAVSHGAIETITQITNKSFKSK